MILRSLLNIPHTTYVQYLFPPSPAQSLYGSSRFSIDEKSTHSNLSPSLSSTHPFS